MYKCRECTSEYNIKISGELEDTEVGTKKGFCTPCNAVRYMDSTELPKENGSDIPA